jgi:hypothetical protein
MATVEPAAVLARLVARFPELRADGDLARALARRVRRLSPRRAAPRRAGA